MPHICLNRKPSNEISDGQKSLIERVKCLIFRYLGIYGCFRVKIPYNFFFFFNFHSIIFHSWRLPGQLVLNFFFSVLLIKPLFSFQLIFFNNKPYSNRVFHMLKSCLRNNLQPTCRRNKKKHYTDRPLWLTRLLQVPPILTMSSNCSSHVHSLNQI